MCAGMSGGGEAIEERSFREGGGGLHNKKKKERRGGRRLFQGLGKKSKSSWLGENQYHSKGSGKGGKGGSLAGPLEGKFGLYRQGGGRRKLEALQKIENLYWRCGFSRTSLLRKDRLTNREERAEKSGKTQLMKKRGKWLSAEGGNQKGRGRLHVRPSVMRETLKVEIEREVGEEGKFQPIKKGWAGNRHL